MDESLDNGKLLYSGARSAEQTRNAVSNDGLSSAVKRRSIPDSLLPQSVEGIGYMLADAALRLTRSPAVVVVRDPAMQTASVVTVRLTRCRVSGAVSGSGCWLYTSSLKEHPTP